MWNQRLIVEKVFDEYEHGELVQQLHQGVELDEGISKLRRRDDSPRPCQHIHLGQEYCQG